MKTGTRHTPTPWYCGNASGQGLVIAESDGRNVAVTYDGMADAEFIVQAVNNHDALVGLVQRALSMHTDNPISVSPDKWIADARTLLSRVEGKK